MKLFSLALFLVWLKKVTPLHCRCSGAACDIPLLDTCHAARSCFTETIAGNTTYGCIRSPAIEKVFCNRTYKIMTLKCCSTDLCNSNGLPSKPSLRAPTIKLAKLVKRTVVVSIKDTQRSKIDGYVATIYTPGEQTRNYQILKPSTRSFTFDYLFVNTTYVIEVVSHKGSITSERSKAITITTETPECDYYKKGEVNGKKRKSCTSFGCYSTWAKNGTNLELLGRGCWNDVSVSKCHLVKVRNSLAVICTCNKKRCTPKYLH